MFDIEQNMFQNLVLNQGFLFLLKLSFSREGMQMQYALDTTWTQKENKFDHLLFWYPLLAQDW